MKTSQQYLATLLNFLFFLNVLKGVGRGTARASSNGSATTLYVIMI